jgi:hypothetical protein
VVKLRPILPALGFFCGLLLATIATLTLVLTGVLKATTAVRQKREEGQSVLKVSPNSLALLIYLVLVVWMSMLLLFVLSDGPYIGN